MGRRTNDFLSSRRHRLQEMSSPSSPLPSLRARRTRTRRQCSFAGNIILSMMTTANIIVLLLLLFSPTSCMAWISQSSTISSSSISRKGSFPSNNPQTAPSWGTIRAAPFQTASNSRPNLRVLYATKPSTSSSSSEAVTPDNKKKQQEEQNDTAAKFLAEKKQQTAGLVYNANKIRNFSIIAHIDHGKSTLADRLLESTRTVAARDMEEQLLDNMDLERERGITIKLQAARVLYTSTSDGETYCLNLIDTPGHVDFSYEVSRSLAACEGALLVVDASQGIEAQTLANVYLALENDLEIIPVLNKIDLPAADPDRVAEEIEQTIGLDCTDIVKVSAKAGIGIEAILERIVKDVPPPAAATGGPFRALIFDSYYDSYRGVVVFFRVVDGQVRKGDVVRFLASAAEYEVTEVGIMQPNQVPVETLRAGEVGYLWGNIKEVTDARVGDTIALAKEYKSAKTAKSKDGDDSFPIKPLPGYADSKPMVYCGLFPVDADEYDSLRDAIGKLRLNDAALTYEPETSGALGFGFRCGFLGLLHMEIVQERLQREYNIDLIVTAPTVVYKVRSEGKEKLLIVDTPAKMPDLVRGDEALEPYVRMDILTPSEYNGAIIELGQERRGVLIDIKYLTPTRSTITYELPLAEVIMDFFDQLKSRTKGYASMEYKVIDYRASDLVRLDVKINYETAPPLACVVHRDKAQSIGRRLCEALKEEIPRQMFKIPIQACVGVKVIASQSISPMRKDVLAKCYGGDITRKKKLLQKQAKGKKRMKAIGKVSVPQEAFLAIIRMGQDK